MAYPISDVTRRIIYSGSAGVGPYSFSFEILEQTDVAVYKNSTLLTLTTDYSVTINADGTGSVTLVSAASASDQITLFGDRAIERSTDFVTGGDLFANSLNEELDSQTIFAQQIDEKADRAIKAPITDPTTIDMTLPSKADRADKILAFDVNGNPALTSEADIAAGISGAIVGANYVVTNATGNGSSVAFTVSSAPGAKSNIQIYIDGVYQNKDTFSIAGTTVTFTEAPPSGAAIEFVVGYAIGVGGGAAEITYTPAGTGAVTTTVQAKLRETVSVMDFGAVGDGVTDDTAAIQAAIDSGAGSVFFPAGTYLVSKTSAFSSDFPNNDQPCLFVKSKTNFKLYGEGGAKLITTVHAQGILELQLCSDVVIDGLEFQGAGNYPQLDGTTGRGEKGTNTQGYNSASNGWGFYKNNSFNTSALTSGGFGGAFPQWGGGTATTWGVWNDGYIGNVAYGVLIHNGCSRVTVSSCKVSDFNYVGIGVGHNGDYFPTDLGYTDSTDIKFVNCEGNGCYSTNFNSMAVDGFLMDSCVTENCGHPDALITDANHDPGYGYTARGSNFSYTKNATISNNIVRNCKRKGLDSHAHENIAFVGNTVSNCWVGGIYWAWSSNTQKAIGTVCSGNTLDECAIGTSTLGGIYSQGRIDGDYSYDNILLNASITGNVVRNSGDYPIYVRVGRDVTIDGNVVTGVSSNSASASAFYGIFVGRSVDTSYQVTVTNNIVDAAGSTRMNRGIQVNNLEEGVVANNVIKLDHASANIGLYHIGATKTDYYGNRVNVSAGTAIAISPTSGATHSNYWTGGALASSSFSTSTVEYKVPTRIALRVEFNGTSSPSVVYYSGSNYVDSVSTIAFGLRIALKNLVNAQVNPSFVQNSSDGLLVGATAVEWAYVRSNTVSAVEIGTKLSQTSAGHVDGAAITSGVLLITIDVM